MSILCKIEMTFFFEHGKIDNGLTERHAHARLPIARPEDSKGKIFQRKM
jgi:hypothetical protein